MRYFIVAMLIAVLPVSSLGQDSTRPRARDLGLAIGIFNTGEHNAITDVPGVHVGHTTVLEGSRVRTGVTAILSLIHI